VEARGGAEPIEPATVSEAQVHLVGAARIPSRSVVTAENRNLSEKQPMLFEPDDTWLAESRLQVEDSLLDLDETGQVSLVIHNPTGESLRLDAGDSIGVATACLDPDQPEGAVSEIASMEEVSDVSWLGPRARRRRRRKPRQSGRQAGERLPETDQDGTRVTRGRVKKRRRVL
jgi:hypothetical protein